MKPDAEYDLYFDRPYIDITESAKKDKYFRIRRNKCVFASVIRPNLC